ncbi:MAG: ABC transporter permease [Thermodesulfobacteriota bacterium]|nr:ABC transporter permease [Thermodesulfobacteriota bacterium]
MVDGKNFTDHDVDHAGRVCLIGQTLVNELFGGNRLSADRFALEMFHCVSLVS